MWYTFCENPQAIVQLYTAPPSLDDVEIHEIIMQRDGPHMQLRVELGTFPDKPPAKWPKEANAIQMTLDVWGVRELDLAGWGTTNRGTLTFSRTGENMVRFAFTSPTLHFTGQCLATRIGHFSAYEG